MIPTSLIRRIRYETGMLGVAQFGFPFLVILLFLGISLLADVTSNTITPIQSHRNTARTCLLILEFGIPPVAGFAAAFLIDGNPAKEVHFTLKTSYRAVMLTRLGILFFWFIVCSLVLDIVIHVTGYAIAPQMGPQQVFIWLAPLLWFMGLGAALTLLLRTHAASSAVLGMVWLGEKFLQNYFIANPVLQKIYPFLTYETLPGGEAYHDTYWLTNRVTLVLSGVFWFVIVGLLLGNTETLLGNEQ